MMKEYIIDFLIENDKLRDSSIIRPNRKSIRKQNNKGMKRASRWQLFFYCTTKGII